MAKLKVWELLKRQSLFESPYVKLYQETLKRADGKVIENYYSVWRNNWVVIAALTADNKLVLVYQYRNGIKDLEWALPAGHIEGNQTPREAAERELLEETGFTAETFEEIGSFSPSSAFSSEKGHIFLATGAKRTQDQTLDENEEIEVELEDLNLLTGEILTGKSRLIDSSMVLAILLTREKLKKNV